MIIRQKRGNLRTIYDFGDENLKFTLEESGDITEKLLGKVEKIERINT